MDDFYQFSETSKTAVFPNIPSEMYEVTFSEAVDSRQ